MTNNKILVIEDEKAMSNALKNKLENEGFTVDVATTLDEANEFIAKNSYRLITLDLIVNGKSGFLLLEEHTKIKTPIFVISSLSQEDDKKKAFALGASAYFSKLECSIHDIVAEIVKKTNDQ